MFWKPIFSIAFAILLTVILFFVVYVAAYFIALGAMKLAKMLRDKWHETFKSDKTEDYELPS